MFLKKVVLFPVWLTVTLTILVLPVAVLLMVMDSPWFERVDCWLGNFWDDKEES